MNQLPETDNVLVLRTDFSDDAAWQAICAAIQAPVGPFRAYVDCVSSRTYDGITMEEIVALIPTDFEHDIVFVVDSETLSHPEHPVLVVDAYAEPGRSFRVIPAEVWGVENNLSLANMDFAEFADAVDADGVFRGFREAGDV